MKKLGGGYYKLFSASVISNLGDGIATIAYPWLASALTRNPLLIALVAVVQHLPWLLFSLPAGVITDRYDRRRLMVGANATRAVLTLGVAIALISGGDDLPGPDQLDDASFFIDTNIALYLVVLLATLLLGTAEVLYDNTAQTLMPSVVETDQLEKANGRLWSVEQVANSFGGRFLGALLLSVSFALPFVFDAVTFAVSAALITLIRLKPRPQSKAAQSEANQFKATERASMRAELKEGFSWLWGHEFLRPLAIILGTMNGLSALSSASMVLFAQEVLSTSTTEFAILETGGAIGGILAGWTAASVSKKLGSGPSLWLTLITGSITGVIIGSASNWPIVWVMFGLFMFTGVLWNVITVALRQSVIPDDLLGRVNSVYRFFAWGAIPIGALLGGLIVLVSERAGVDRTMALRLPWFVSGVGHLVLLLIAGSRLTTARIEAVRATAEVKVAE